MEQTNRTILFEEINPEKADLLTLIRGDGKLRSLNDEDIYRVHQCLKVSSYEEFVDLFNPFVNMNLDTEKCSVKFSRDDNIGGTKIFLTTEKSLLNSLMRLIESKKDNRYLLKSFDDMLVHFFPMKDISDFYVARNQILADIRSGNVQNLETKIEALMVKYEDGIFLLNAYIHEVRKVVLENQNELGKDKGILDDNGLTQIKVIRKSKKYKYRVYRLEEEQADIYKDAVEKCVNLMAQRNNFQHSSLFIACLMMPIWYGAQEFAMIQMQYEKYIKLYTNIIKEFWKIAKPLLEVCLGIKEFFAPYDRAEGTRPTLIITNVSISELIQPKNKELLELYLKTVNTKNDLQNTIWYSIIPSVLKEGKKKENIIRERFLASGEQDNYAYNEIEDVTILLEILAKYKIQNFVSMALLQQYTFSSIAINGADTIKECLHIFDGVADKDYCIPCLPNFTIISKSDAYQIVGEKIIYNDLTEKMEIKEENVLWLEQIGIGAAYVAAGLVAACQCPEFLKKYYGNKVNDKIPGVSYRFSDGNNYLKTTSSMLSSVIGFSKELENELNEYSRGILFGSKKGKTVILTERVLSYSHGNKLLLPMIQTMNYIERKIQYETQDFKKNLIQQFFQKRPGSVLSEWYPQNKDVVNNILKENEHLEYEMDEKGDICTFHVWFSENELVRSETVSVFKE